MGHLKYGASGSLLSNASHLVDACGQDEPGVAAYFITGAEDNLSSKYQVDDYIKINGAQQAGTGTYFLGQHGGESMQAAYPGQGLVLDVTALMLSGINTFQFIEYNNWGGISEVWLVKTIDSIVSHSWKVFDEFFIQAFIGHPPGDVRASKIIVL